MPARIYDSFALLKLFQKERHYEKIARLLEEDRNGGYAISYADAFPISLSR